MSDETRILPNLRKALTIRHIRFMALGSAIGSGLFLGSSGAISLAGPAVMLVYLIGGIAVFMVLRALGEMIVHKPAVGSFQHYAGTYLWPFAGFVTGWTYVFEMIIVCQADVTAFSIYMRFWYPNVDQWIWALIIIFLIGIMNLCHVRLFGEMEFVLSLIKVTAIVVMIIGGGILIVHGVGVSHPETGISNLWANGGFFPNGLAGMLTALPLALFAFGGVEIIGITASEAKDPHKIIPQAINSVPIRILLFYVLTLFVLMSVYPWNGLREGGSPFVEILNQLGIGYAPHILNIVVIMASVSAINNDIFGAGRMIHGLAHDGQAPRIFVRLSSYQVPWVTIVTIIAALLGVVVLNYVMPEKVFLFIAGIATFATIFVWIMILLTQWAMRRNFFYKRNEKIIFPMPFGLGGTAATLSFMVFIIVIMGFFEESRLALMVGCLWIIFLSIFYTLFKQKMEATKSPLHNYITDN